MWKKNILPSNTYLRTFVDDIRHSEAGACHDVHHLMVKTPDTVFNNKGLVVDPTSYYEVLVAAKCPFRIT